jgi:hypothetical protein
MPTAPTPSNIIDPALAMRIARVEQKRPHELREFKAQLDVEGGPFVDGRDGQEAWMTRRAGGCALTERFTASCGHGETDAGR